MVGFYNPDRRSSVFIVPGLIGVILTMTMVLFTAIAIVRERERGNMELLIATPMTRAELMVGKVLPYMAIGLVQTGVILALGVWIFAVPVRGWLSEVFAAATAYRRQPGTGPADFHPRPVPVPGDADDLLRVPAINPAVGFHVPLCRLPKLAQWLAEVLPLTHFLRLIRGVMLRGAGLLELWPDVPALVGFTVIMMTVAILSSASGWTERTEGAGRGVRAAQPDQATC